MAEDTKDQTAAPAEIPAPTLHVAPGPHICDTSLTTRKMMLDVIIALVPVMLMSLIVFGQYALTVIALCVGSCVVTEAVCTLLRGRKLSLGDLSAVVTGLILAMSLPAAAGTAGGWHTAVIGSAVAIALAKILFGGLGQNIFNPAMVGRAFVMLAFAGVLGAGGYVIEGASVDVVTQATPMTQWLDSLKPEAAADTLQATLGTLIVGNTNGSLGETSALACLIGGLYLVIRRTASWEIPVGVLAAAAVVGGVANVLQPGPWTVLHHLCGGALLFGAFYIATDPVSSPLTPKGKIIFGAGIGVLVMLIRLWANYPEGVMFAVLLMNAAVPLINGWTNPRPVGGPTPAAAGT